MDKRIKNYCVNSVNSAIDYAANIDSKKQMAEEERKEAEEQAAAEKEVAKKAEEERKEAEEQAAKEQKAKSDEIQQTINGAKILGVDLVMEAHSDSFIGKYYKMNGVVEKIDDGACLIRYLSTINNHRNMYEAWILTNDTLGVNVGDNISVVAEYVGFAEESTVPTLKQYKMEKSSDSIYSKIYQKAKFVNCDISFEELLRYGEYQEFVYIEGEVDSVFENNLYISDEYGNRYVIFDKRVNKNVILRGDYICVYGTFDGLHKGGYVYPKISWITE